MRELFRLHCERATFPETVTGLRLEVTWAETLHEQQTALFEDAHDQQQRTLGLLLERLSSRLGDDAVLWPQPVEDAQPEWAFSFMPVMNDRERNPPRVPGECELRPWQLFSPRRIDVLSAVPDGPPQRWFDNGEARMVARVWGPERIETGWWRDRDVKRDYYRVELTDGTHWWLFRERESGTWYVHGEFS